MIKKSKTNVVVACSGGPDSIYLLNQFIVKTKGKWRTKFLNIFKKTDVLSKYSSKYRPIVAHVNYHFRETSNNDQQLVVDFCQEHNLRLEILDVDSELMKKYAHLKNKQFIARKIRYDFFFKIARELNIKKVFIAHQKDDFIETALMQQFRSQNYTFYGIEAVTKIQQFEIIRPLLKIYKYEILQELNDEQIPFIIDETNNQDIYERNKLRHQLDEYSIEKKDGIYDYFQNLNYIKKSFNKKVFQIYQQFKESNFSWNYFNSIDKKYRKYVIYKYLSLNFEYMNITDSKLNALDIFLQSNQPYRFYRLRKNTSLTIKDNKIIIINK